MSPADEPLSAFERNARQVLQESLLRIDARTRSRLNQARHAALEAASAPRARWRSFTLVPATGAAAALLVALFLWHGPGSELPFDAQHSTEDVELLADNEALELMEGGDGQFYEWAANQSEGNGESEG